MKILKKILSVMMAGVMAFTMLCLPASAANDFESAKLVDSGKKVSFTTKYNKFFPSGKGEGESLPYIYKVKLSEAGTLKLTVVSQTESIYFDVLNDDASECIPYDKVKCITGSSQLLSNDCTEWIHWNGSLKKSKTEFEYKLEKGTYFVRVRGSSNSEIAGKTSISFSYPQDKEEESGKISYLALEMEKGDTLKLGAIIEGEGTVKWSSSKSSVVSVTSKGKITAKKKGSAIITAKLGSSIVKLKIKVV